MEEKMKKMLFLMLFLLILGAASVSAQVRIGGNGVPNGAAVLDLNVNDNTNTGTKGLALPRVNLADNTAQITTGTANLNGMLVYNTGGSLSAGVYYWSGTNWLKITNSPVGTADIADGAVTAEKLNAMGAVAGSTLVNNGSGWVIAPQDSVLIHGIYVDVPAGLAAGSRVDVPNAALGLPAGFSLQNCQGQVVEWAGAYNWGWNSNGIYAILLKTSQDGLAINLRLICFKMNFRNW